MRAGLLSSRACPLGEWYFQEATTWFLFLAILIGIVGKLSESEIVNTFLSAPAI